MEFWSRHLNTSPHASQSNPWYIEGSQAALFLHVGADRSSVMLLVECAAYSPTLFADDNDVDSIGSLDEAVSLYKGTFPQLLAASKGLVMLLPSSVQDAFFEESLPGPIMSLISESGSHVNIPILLVSPVFIV